MALVRGRGGCGPVALAWACGGGGTCGNDGGFAGVLRGGGAGGWAGEGERRGWRCKYLDVLSSLERSCVRGRELKQGERDSVKLRLSKVMMRMSMIKMIIC